MRLCGKCSRSRSRPAAHWFWSARTSSNCRPIRTRRCTSGSGPNGGQRHWHGGTGLSEAGLTVEFVAEVDKTHTVKEKISHLLIVTPTTDRPVGLLAAGVCHPGKEGQRVKRARKAESAEADKPAPLVARRLTSEGRRPKGPERRPAVSRAPYRTGNDQDVQGRQDHGFGRAGATVKAELASDVTIDVTWPISAPPSARRQGYGGRFCHSRPPNHGHGKIDHGRVGQSAHGGKKHAAHPAKTPAGSAGKAKKEPAGDLPDLGK